VPAFPNHLVRPAAFQNPEFYRAQAMRLPTYDKPRIIDCAEDHPQYVALPRGCLADVQALFDNLKIKSIVRDERFGGTRIVASFKGELRAEQQLAANALLAHEVGVLSTTTAFGKTVVAAWLIAQRGINTLVLVHRQASVTRTLRAGSSWRTVGRLLDETIKKPYGMVDDSENAGAVVDPDIVIAADFIVPQRPGKLAPKAGLEPATRRLTADCSTIELLWNPSGQLIYKPFGGASIAYPIFITVEFWLLATAMAPRRIRFSLRLTGG
jgi:hypothetical protein